MIDKNSREELEGANGVVAEPSLELSEEIGSIQVTFFEPADP
ncbi:unnamed protein product [Brassica oleracea]